MTGIFIDIGPDENDTYYQFLCNEEMKSPFGFPFRERREIYLEEKRFYDANYDSDCLHQNVSPSLWKTRPIAISRVRTTTETKITSTTTTAATTTTKTTPTTATF